MGLGLGVKYEREELLLLLRQLAVKLDRPPRAEDIIREQNFPSCPVFQRHFGGLAAAREEAGLAEPPRRVQWTPKVFNEALLKATRELGRAPTERDLNRLEYLPSPQTVRKIAGSLREALASLGLKKGKKWHPNDDISEKVLVLHLQEVAQRLGTSPTMKAFRKAGGKYSDKLYIQRFGSWNAALTLAGLSLHRQDVPTRDTLCKRLVVLQQRLGRPPQVRDLQQHPDMPPATAYGKQFKNWHEALTCAGISTSHLPVQVDLLDDERLLGALQELARRLGRTPDTMVALHLPGFPSPKIFSDRFGSWNNAILAAGLPVNRRKYRARDGHKCDSRQERLVDDFFTEHGVIHELHPLYPQHPELNPRMDRVADWRLQDGTLVEFFGVLGKTRYEEKSRLKVELARATGVTLIAIYPRDLRRRDRLQEIFDLKGEG